MGARNRMRARPVSIDVINRHNKHDKTSWDDLQAEQTRKKKAKKNARQQGQFISDDEYELA